MNAAAMTRLQSPLRSAFSLYNLTRSLVWFLFVDQAECERRLVQSRLLNFRSGTFSGAVNALRWSCTFTGLF
jgi:hypothetical protein